MKMHLDISIAIRGTDERGYMQPGGLEIREQITVSVESFMEAAKILGLFHDLAQTLSKRGPQ